MLVNFTLLSFRFTYRAREAVFLPAVNKGNTLRGAFGMHFKRLVCISPRDCRDRCRSPQVCPYGQIFQPSPPPDSERLRSNQDIPRPFVIRPPLARQTVIASSEHLEFGLVIFGRVVDFFPYFAVTFKSLGEEGLGRTRASLDLERVAVLDASGKERDVYSNTDNLFRNLNRTLSISDLLDNGFSTPPRRLTLDFLTPTVIKSDAETVVKPEFHHVLRRLRDRINALSYFYCGETMDVDYRALGEAAREIRTVASDLCWEDRFRRSWRTGHRHPMGGFVGRITFEGDFTPFWPLLVLGQYTHVGKYAVWGNGWYRVLV